MSASRLSRRLSDLEAAGYVRRRIERKRLSRRDSNGLHLVRATVIVLLTNKFFADLGLIVCWKQAQKAAQKRRRKQLQQVEAALRQHEAKKQVTADRRQRSRGNWLQFERRLDEERRREVERVHANRVVTLAQKLGISGREAEELILSGQA
ncbi:hypothetical protein FQZ97_1008800 [compost metagenome]